jgi:hypothetical protein
MAAMFLAQEKAQSLKDVPIFPLVAGAAAHGILKTEQATEVCSSDARGSKSRQSAKIAFHRYSPAHAISIRTRETGCS